MKRLAVLAVTVVALTSPAMAQESVTATGAMEKLGITTYQYGTHAVTDKALGAFYGLSSDAVDLDAYTGQRAPSTVLWCPGTSTGRLRAVHPS